MKGIQIIKFKKVFIESLRIFGLLLHKCWLVRKRQWITSLVGEILVPISLIFWVWVSSGTEGEIGLDIENETHYESRSFEQLIDLMNYWHGEVLYAPSNPFTDELMLKVNECFKHKFNISGFDTEFKLIERFSTQDYWNTAMAVVFDEFIDESTKHLHYKFRGRYIKLNNLYNLGYEDLTAYYCEYTFFVQIQICLDRSYIQMKSNKTVTEIPEVSIQQIPYPAHTNPSSPLTLIYAFTIPCVFVIPLLFETSKATREKFTGINVLMSMNGIPNTLNMLSWIISGLVLLSSLCLMTVVILVIPPNGYSYSALNYGNPFIVFVAFIFHFLQSIAFATHLSAYFSKSFHLTFILIFISLAILIVRFFVLPIFCQSIPFMTTIFPIISLNQIMEEISRYEEIGIGVQWSNLFENANPMNKFEGSIGMLLVLSLIGTFLHFWLAVYVNVIKPGKYGVGKHPLFFLMRKKKQNHEYTVKNLIFDNKNNKYFEPIMTGAFIPGIQIRDLTKAYDISIIKKEKVHALQGISMDFYKGQITTILGHNGAGKSSLMSILTGVINATNGLILIDSKNLKDSASEILTDVGFYAQNDMYFPPLTVNEQLMFFAMIKKGDKSRSTIKSNIDALINKLKLVNVKDSLPHKLSEDQKRKLCLGMAFVGDPSTLILDEPTARLDQENKRLIWDILLEMKGRKTILISTHDMEEADILGDRIAIMHEGRIQSYGTPLFLKKMIGGQDNIEITLSIERWSDPDRIRNQLDSQAIIIEKQDKKIIVRVPISSSLPESLKILEEKKNDLGITGYVLSPVGLEQVFLKVAEDCEKLSKTYEVTSSNKLKLKGVPLYAQKCRALIAKKFNYFLKDSKTFFIQILVLLSLTGTLVAYEFIKEDWFYGSELKIVRMQLNAYDDTYTLYQSTDENFGIQYKSICESFDATNTKVTNGSLDDELLKLAKKDLIMYRNYLIAAAEFKKSTVGHSIANAFYSETITLSLPISINLLSNVIIRNLTGLDYSISISGQALSTRHTRIELTDIMNTRGYIAAIIFAVPIYFMIAMFAAHPVRESARGLKHLQKMTGISGFTYWATMFISDLAHYMILVILLIIGLICLDFFLDLQFYGITEIMIMILLLMLFAFNGLPLVYSLSFMRTKTTFVLKFLTLIPIGIVITDILLLFYYDTNEEQYFYTRTVHLLFPYVSFLQAQARFHTTGLLNAVCRKSSDDFYATQCQYSEGLCCEENCKDRSCQKLIPYFLGDDIDSLSVSVIYLCVMPILYFGILATLESQYFQRMISKCAKRTIESECFEKIISKFARQSERKTNIDEQVQLEKLNIFQKIQESNKSQSSRHTKKPIDTTSNEELFLAYELRKFYRNVKAVEDVSFRIMKCECFGLFGANRTGKSTILGMMTGKEIPDSGVMFTGDEQFSSNKKFLSQLGYCLQYDATLKYLNTYDHLRLFARLRGIAEDQIEDEVQTWITKLCLNAYASQPSSTLSSGNNQRLNIAMALVGNPNLILLDEPTTRMDPGAKRSFYRTVKSCQSSGQTFLLASHNIDECEALCRRTVVMEYGKLLFIGSPKELKQRFGAGYDVQIWMNSAKVNNQLNKIKKDMRLLLHCVLTNEHSHYLMYHVIGVCTTWTKIYEVMNKIKSRYDCVDDFVVVVRLST